LSVPLTPLYPLLPPPSSSLFIAFQSLPVRNSTEIRILESTIQKIKNFVASELGLKTFYFTNPLFFSRMDGRKARTFHDEVS
jgi:hypothetical protein